MSVTVDVLAYRNPDGTFKVWATDNAGLVCYGKATNPTTVGGSQVTKETKLKDGYQQVAQIRLQGCGDLSHDEGQDLFRQVTAGVAAVVVGLDVALRNMQQVVAQRLLDWLGRDVTQARDYYDRVLSGGRCGLAFFEVSVADLNLSAQPSSKQHRAIKSACVVADGAWNF